MWSITHSRPLGKQLMRQITLFVFAILMVLFVAVAARTETVFAQTPQATWNGDIIEYDGQSFTKQDPAPSLPGTVCETRGIIYAYFTHQDNDPTKPVTQARVICFKDSEADKSKEIPANVVTFPDATSQSGDGPVTYGSRAVDATSTDTPRAPVVMVVALVVQTLKPSPPATAKTPTALVGLFARSPTGWQMAWTSCITFLVVF